MFSNWKKEMFCFTVFQQRDTAFTQLMIKQTKSRLTKRNILHTGLGYLLDPFVKTEEDLEKDWSPRVWKDILAALREKQSPHNKIISS